MIELVLIVGYVSLGVLTALTILFLDIEDEPAILGMSALFWPLAVCFVGMFALGSGILYVGETVGKAVIRLAERKT